MMRSNTMNGSKRAAAALLFPFLFGACTDSGGSGSDFDRKKGFESEPEKVSYALGVNIGANVAEGMKKQGIDSVDAAIIAQGIIDRMNDKDLLVKEDSAQNVIRSYFQKVKKRKRQANKEEGEQFLEEKRAEDDVKRTEKDLHYKVLQEGSGEKPDSWDSVRVSYTGTKIDGESFDSNEDAQFPVSGGIVQGWTEALQMMKEGAEWEVYLPPELAYGQGGRGEKIGPSETLIFELQLKEVIEVDSAEAAQQQQRRPGGMQGGGQGLSPQQKRKLQQQMRRQQRQR